MQATANLLATPPERVCLLRLSAIGDTCHVVPLLRTLQDAWPSTRFTWVIGKLEAKLMSLIPDVELITLDKGAGLAAYGRLRAKMQGRGGFDLLLHLQLSIRASVAAAMIPAPLKLGFDKARARELQWLFTNRRIAARQREHVLDSFMGFADALGIAAPAPALGHSAAFQPPWPMRRICVPDPQRTLVISACSSHTLRNWSPERYAAVADYAANKHGMTRHSVWRSQHRGAGDGGGHPQACTHAAREPGGQGHAAAAARAAGDAPRCC